MYRCTAHLTAQTLLAAACAWVHRRQAMRLPHDHPSGPAPPPCRAQGGAVHHTVQVEPPGSCRLCGPRVWGPDSPRVHEAVQEDGGGREPWAVPLLWLHRHPHQVRHAGAVPRRLRRQLRRAVESAVPGGQPAGVHQAGCKLQPREGQAIANGTTKRTHETNPHPNLAPSALCLHRLCTTCLPSSVAAPRLGPPS